MIQTPTFPVADFEITGKIYLFRKFVDQINVHAFLDESKLWSCRRVICGSENISYSEQIIPDNSMLFNYFASSDIVSISKKIKNTTNALKSMFCWTSIYEKGEFINPHKDRAGDIQLLMCLKNDGFDSHGLFCFKIDNEKYDVMLCPGDLIYFIATETIHFTTPLIETSEVINPQRIVAISRQFFN